MIEGFRSGRELLEEDAEPFLDALIAETDEALIGRVLTQWHKKGIEANEIYQIARIMKSRMLRVNSRYDSFADIVGTGGSIAKTFNVSTGAAFVVAGAGLPVAKHGNKAATSNSGSADVLSELGIDSGVVSEIAERCLNEIGICFMFAPNFHRLSSTLGKVRRGLGFPTIFNCVGPLCNPASAPHQLIGVWDRTLVPKIANALARLGTKRSWIVHGENGQDEIISSGRTYVAEVGKEVREFEIAPEDFGFDRTRSDSLPAGDPPESAAMIRGILSGDRKGRAEESIVLLNAAAALCIAEESGSPRGAADHAAESLRSGAAFEMLTELARATPA